MKTILITTAFLCLVAMTTQAQTFFKDTNGKYGLKDTNGKIISKGKYISVGKFENGLAIVEGETAVGNLFGVIDITGKEIAEVKYTEIELGNFGSSKHEILIKALDFNAVFWTLIDPKTGKDITASNRYYIIESFINGKAKVEGANEKSGKGHTQGYIDESGKEVVPLSGVEEGINAKLFFEYEWVGDFSQELAVVKLNNKYGYIDRSGERIIPLVFDTAEVFTNGFAKVTFKGKNVFIMNPTYTNKYKKYPSSEGLTPIEYNGKFGFEDENDMLIVLPKYDNVIPFSGGFAAVCLKNKEGYNDWGFIDKTGNEIVSPKYYSVKSFSQGRAAVKDWKWGYIDETGKEVVPQKYDQADTFSEGLAAVLLKEKWGFIDNTGKEVISFKYILPGYFSEGLVKVSKGYHKDGYIDKGGKTIIPFKYRDAGNFSEGLASHRVGFKHGFIDKIGTVVIPPKYDEVFSFSEGLVAVRVGYDWGFIDKTGKDVIPLIYNKVASFSGGYAKVLQNGRVFYIDKTGKEIK